LSVNGRQIEASTELPALIASLKPGSDATLSVWRDGHEQPLKVRVAKLGDEEAERAANTSPGDATSTQTPRLGLSVRPLTPEEQREAQTDGRLVVEQVQGPAAAAGVQPGDIVLAVGASQVKSVEDLRKAAQNSKGSAPLLIQREGARIYVPVRVG
jgi:serine protease Do